jgi:hypothetical protein
MFGVKTGLFESSKVRSFGAHDGYIQRTRSIAEETLSDEQR